MLSPALSTPQTGNAEVVTAVRALNANVARLDAESAQQSVDLRALMQCPNDIASLDTRAGALESVNDATTASFAAVAQRLEALEEAAAPPTALVLDITPEQELAIASISRGTFLILRGDSVDFVLQRQ
jgi:hypothetical protein